VTWTASKRGPLLFEVAVFAALACLLIRGALPAGGSPNFSAEPVTGLRIVLGDGFPEPGLHQYSDGMTIGGVIELTRVASHAPELRADPLVDQRLGDGATLDIVENEGESHRLSTGWLPARQRLALGITLHPDRMSQEDWVSLPGIGEKLASQIEFDRQKYGDFGSLAALERVKGIGPAKLKALRPFFL
jgi:competence protein ComEA